MDVKLILITVSHSFLSILIVRLSLVIPALFISTSIFSPNSVLHLSINPSSSSCAEISCLIITMFIFAFKFVQFFSLVPETKRFAFKETSVSTNEKPIPPVAPVIIIFFIF